MSIQIERLRKKVFMMMAASLVATVVGVAMVSLVVDPYGIYRLADINGLNRIKPYPDHDLEIIKGYGLNRVRPEALILGNSRAEIGFDPKHPAWRAAGYSSIYNAAIPGSGPGVGLKLLNASGSDWKPKFILLGVDFFDFPISPDFKQKPSPTGVLQAGSSIPWRFRSLFTMQAALDAATTVRRQYQLNPAQLTDLGFNPLLEYRDLARAHGYWPLFRQRAEENAKNHGRKPGNLFVRGTRTSPDFDAVRSIIRWARDNDVKLTIVTYPYHVQLLMLISEVGLWPLFEAWKQEMTQIVDEEASGTNARIALNDFGTISAYSVEAIPPKGDRNTETKWYWEAGHFKKELGDLILAQCLAQDSGTPMAFGVPLSRDNIAGHLAAQNQALVVYGSEHPEVRDEVREIVGKMRSPVARKP